jgi:uncharacterized membrane protein YfcA
LVISSITAPVGVSGAVFLLPIQLSVLGVASPAVTPTNLLFNVVATPGALLRYWRKQQIDFRLAGQLLVGTVPGVIAGSLLRVYVLPGQRAFRVLAGIVLLSVGVWVISRSLARRSARQRRGLAPRTIVGLAVVVGVVGGIYGIGGGSVLGPVLVGTGMSVSVVAPAALASTFVTSLAGALTYGALALATTGPVAANWTLGVACGLGGLLGGYVGAQGQRFVPERALRLLLGTLAAALGLLYFVQAARA